MVGDLMGMHLVAPTQCFHQRWLVGVNGCVRRFCFVHWTGDIWSFWFDLWPACGNNRGKGASSEHELKSHWLISAWQPVWKTRTWCTLSKMVTAKVPSLPHSKLLSKVSFGAFNKLSTFSFLVFPTKKLMFPLFWGETKHGRQQHQPAAFCGKGTPKESCVWSHQGSLDHTVRKLSRLFKNMTNSRLTWTLWLISLMFVSKNETRISTMHTTREGHWQFSHPIAS